MSNQPPCKVLDLSSLEAVWVVVAQDGIDEGERLICFSTNEVDARQAMAQCEIERDGLIPKIDPNGKPLSPAGYSGTSYRVEMVERWPTFGARADEAGFTRADRDAGR